MFAWFKIIFTKERKSLKVRDNKTVATSIVKIAMIWDLKQRSDSKYIVRRILDISPTKMVEQMNKDVTIVDLTIWLHNHLIHDSQGTVLNLERITHAQKIPYNIPLLFQMVVAITKHIKQHVKHDHERTEFLRSMCGDTSPIEQSDAAILADVETIIISLLDVMMSDDFKVVIDVERATPRELDYFLFQLDYDHTKESSLYYNPHIVESNISFKHFKPTTDWGVGGPYFDRHKLEIFEHDDGLVEVYPKGDPVVPAAGETRLIAACRCVLFNTYHYDGGYIPFTLVSKREVFKDVE